MPEKLALQAADWRGLRAALVLGMGMGEPLQNYAALLPALRVMLDDHGYGLSRRRLTVSTSGAEQAKTFRALGLCQARAGMSDQAERNLLKSHEYDPANPVTLFNLAALMHARGDLPRAQWHVRRLNNSELANAESFWLGVKVERGLDNRVAMEQLSLQLVKRFPLSRESDSLQRGAFDE
ncbi:MAG: hypothetical protein EB007_03200 [Betaproteobacteria bacterium]|nr:hypothetical protein [Betaproteobacteria bacterium]